MGYEEYLAKAGPSATYAATALLDKAAASALPPVTGTPQFPTQDQLTAAGTYVAAHWSAAVS